MILSVMLVAMFTTSNLWAGAPGVTKDSITLGAIVDKSSFMVTAMTNQTNGQLAYFKKAYAEGIYKRKIKLITEDGAYSPAKHLAAGKLLLERDNVFAFTNAVGTSPTLALNNLLMAKKVPLLAVSSQSNRLVVPFKKYIFVQMSAYFDQARICVDYILKQNPKAKIAIVCQDDDFGHEGRDGFLAQLEKYKVKPAGVALYQRGTKDFSSPVIKLKSLNPDYVINHAVAPYGAAVMKEAQKLNFKPKWVCMSGCMGVTFLRLAGGSLDFAGDMYGFMLNYMPDGDTKGAIEYREAIKKYMPKADVGNTFTMWGYGWAKVIVEALKRAEAKNDLTREGVIKAMETLKNFETGVHAPITYSSSFHGAPDGLLLVKRIGETWVPLSSQWIKAK